MALVKIHLKDKTIEFDDVIKLTSEQLAEILKRSATKTEAQWLKPGPKGVRIQLTEQQKRIVLQYKNDMVKGHSGESLIKANLIRFSHHARERIAQRLDKDIFPDPDTLIGMADLVIQSQHVQDAADWRGYGGLSYGFEGEYDGKACTMAIIFDGPMVVVTIITDEVTPAAYALGTLNPKLAEQLKKAREDAVKKAREDAIKKFKDRNKRK